VAVKTEAQQAVLAMHRMRQQLIKFRTMQMNLNSSVSHRKMLSRSWLVWG